MSVCVCEFMLVSDYCSWRAHNEETEWAKARLGCGQERAPVVKMISTSAAKTFMETPSFGRLLGSCSSGCVV